MTKKGFGTLVSLEEAKNIINKITGEMKEEKVAVKNALGRVLAQDIIAKIDVPHFRKSAMDGFAVRAEDSYGASNTTPKTLKIIEHISAGMTPTKLLGVGECTEITTGAALPKNAESVIMVEYTEKEEKEKGGKQELTIYKACAPGDNIIKIGSDVKKGDTVLQKGEKINARYLGVLAAIGVGEVQVKKVPRVAVLSTGDELLEQGEELVAGKIYDINTSTISGALLEQGMTVIPLGLVKDEKEKIKEKILEGVEKADMVLLSGGSSLGTEDMTKEIIEELGTLYVHGIAVKPGKPVIIGEINGVPVLGLPGYPTSSLSNYYILVEPVLNKMMGTRSKENYVSATLTRKIASTIGRYEFLAVRVEEKQEEKEKGKQRGKYRAIPVMKGSSSITTLSQANGFLEIDENTEVLNKGDEVIIRRFD